MESSIENIKKKRNIRNITILIVLTGGLFYTAVKFLPEHKIATNEILSSIPLDASFIVRTNNFNKFLEKVKHNTFLKEISGFDPGRELIKNIIYLDSIADRAHEIEHLFNTEVIFSFHLIGINKIKPVFYIPTGKKTNNQIKNIIESLVKNNGLITGRKYENFNVYDCNASKKQLKFSFTFYKGFLMISPSSILLENSIRQINNDSGINDLTGFKKVESTADKNSLANIYINYKNLPNTLALALNNPYARNLKTGSSFADWTEVDVTLKDNVLLLNGYTHTSDSLNNIESILIGQSPRKFSMHSIFPANSNSFFSILLSDPELFQKNYKKHLMNMGKGRQYASKIENYRKKYGVDIENIFYQSFENEMGVVHCNINPGDNGHEKFFVINTKGENIVKSKFVELLQGWAHHENASLNNYIIEYTVDEGASYKIYKFPEPTIIKDLFGVFYAYDEAKYFTFVNNYLVFSGNANSLSKIIYTNVLNKTLDKTLEYNDFSEYVNSRSNLYFYIKLPKAGGDINKYLNENLQNLYNKNREAFERINTLSFQLSGERDMLYTNITLNYVKKTYDNPVTEWETLLDSSINFKPVFVENHYTREYEIFVQDLKNNIYLINNSGRIVWKISLDEKINSEVFQVDYYKNGKLQLLFSTSKALHLIDRNGNYVERYPVKFRSGATAGISLFDYDNNKNYRIFVPAANMQVYAYGIDGKIITGWDFNRTDHEVLNPVQHFRTDNKDFIVFGDKYKTYILDRRGSTRVKINDQFSKSPKNIYFKDNINGKNCFVTTDIEGRAKIIYFSGETETFDFGKFSMDHFFELNDVDADGEKDFIYVDKNQLKVYKRNKKEIMSFNFENDIINSPAYYYFSARDRKLGIVDVKMEQIYLINNNGKLYKGFPLIGNSMFTVGVLENNYGSFNLIVGGKNSYLYNYAIN